MALKLTYEVTSEQPCQIPVLGTFEAGETKVVDETLQHLFEANFGYKLGSARFPVSVRCTVSVKEEETTAEGTEEV
jgi:hypothetical protein